MIKTIYCKGCVYPISAVNLRIDTDGICSSCKVHKKNSSINKSFWKKRENKLKKILFEYKNKNKNTYDCLIPVSGGKDSYFQAHMIANKYKLKPLLMTYDGNNWLPEAIENRDKMKSITNGNHPCVINNVHQFMKDSQVGAVDITERTLTRLLIVVKNMGKTRIKYDTAISK